MRAGKYLLLGISSLVCLATITGVRHGNLQRAVLPRYTTVVGARVSPLARALRPNYPYSVIPGGAYSPAELRGAVDRDAGVRQHYSGFDLNKTKLVKLTEDRFAYVSFRQNNRFLWTRKRLKIAKGEILLTDGQNFAKTRCGNRLSDVPQRENAAEELPSSVLSPPLLEARQLPDLSFTDAPVTDVAAEESPELSTELSPETPMLPAIASGLSSQPSAESSVGAPAESGPEGFGGGSASSGIGSPFIAAASRRPKAAELTAPLSSLALPIAAPEPACVGSVGIAVCCLALLILSRQRR